MIDEATGNIAVSSSEEVHIYKPYGKEEGDLKVETDTNHPTPSSVILTRLIVVISVLLTRSEPRQRRIDTIMGDGGRAIDWILVSKALSDRGS